VAADARRALPRSVSESDEKYNAIKSDHSWTRVDVGAISQQVAGSDKVGLIESVQMETVSCAGIALPVLVLPLTHVIRISTWVTRKRERRERELAKLDAEVADFLKAIRIK
jgi:hypothetical protein